MVKNLDDDCTNHEDSLIVQQPPPKKRIKRNDKNSSSIGTDISAPVNHADYNDITPTTRNINTMMLPNQDSSSTLLSTFLFADALDQMLNDRRFDDIMTFMQHDFGTIPTETQSDILQSTKRETRGYHRSTLLMTAIEQEAPTPLIIELIHHSAIHGAQLNPYITIILIE